MKNAFYIGYLPKMPEPLKRTIRIVIVTLALASIVLAILLSTGQSPFAKSVFEFGNVRDFEGTIQARPVPFLLVEKERKNNGLPAFFRYPLVKEGKHGVGNLASLDGRRVKLRGTMIYRDGLRMIEVADGTLTQNSVAGREGRDENLAFSGNEVESLGQMTLRGEIIDSKCYLGVMNPGSKKAHRDCAVACLRGGIPALFVVKDGKGITSELWLLSKTGEAVNDQILDYVAEPVELRGRVTRQGDQLFFYADPTRIKRL